MAEVERDLWTSASPASLLKQDQLEQVDQGFVQWSSEYLRGWRIHVSGQTVPGLDHSQGKEVFSYV